ncbi:restriction endonuclease subunit S, partial [Acinetobacter baumannii]
MSINIPQGWALSNLGSIATYINGRAFKPTEWETTGKPIIRIQNLNNPTAPYNYTNQEFQEKYKVKKGDLLFAWSASLGTYIWKNDDAWLNQHIFKVIPHRGIDKNFLFYLLTHVTNELYAKAHGSGMVHVTKGIFDENPALIPPIQQQILIVQKIEELFSEIDDGIQSLETAKKQLDIYREAILIQAFEGKLTEKWRKNYQNLISTGEILKSKFSDERKLRYENEIEKWKASVKEWELKQLEGRKPTKPRAPKDVQKLTKDTLSTLPAIPSEWYWDTLGNITSGVEYGTSAKSQESGSVPVIRMGNIQQGIIDWDDLVYTSDEQEIKQYELKAGDVLFNRTNSPELVGKTAIYKGEQPAIFAGYLIRVNHYSNLIDSNFLNYYLNSHIAKTYGNSVKTDGVNQSNINGEKLQNYPFPFCSLEEQLEIVKIISNFLDKEKVTRQYLDS